MTAGQVHHCRCSPQYTFPFGASGASVLKAQAVFLPPDGHVREPSRPMSVKATWKSLPRVVMESSSTETRYIGGTSAVCIAVSPVDESGGGVAEEDGPNLSSGTKWGLRSATSCSIRSGGSSDCGTSMSSGGSTCTPPHQTMGLSTGPPQLLFFSRLLLGDQSATTEAQRTIPCPPNLDDRLV